MSNIIEKEISKVQTDVMLEFGANQNVARAFPDYRDGLKPVARRVLYTMFIMGLGPKSKKSKVAAIVGNTMRLFHPHGDASIGDNVVNMAQYWKNNIPLVEGEGNFGSPYGDDAAADRYIEARLSSYAHDCFFSEWEDGIVHMKDGLEKEQEPVYLPSKYPNLLINGSFGLGFGYQTNIPLYNFKEVCKMTISLIKNPKGKIKLFPDFPLGGILSGRSDYNKINKTGRGKCKLRANYKVDDDGNLIILNMPYGKTTDKFEKKLYKLVKNNSLHGIKDMKDLSNQSNVIKIKLIIKKNFDPHKVMGDLYSKTGLQDHTSIHFRVIGDGEDFTIGVREYLLDWIDFRVGTKSSIYSRKISKLKHKKHVNEGLIKILEHPKCDETIIKIRSLSNRKEVEDMFIEDFGLTTIQAEGLSSLPIHKFSKDGVSKLKAIVRNIEKEIDVYEDYIKNPLKIRDIIIEELEDGIKKYGTDRRTVVKEDFKEDFVSDTDHVLVITDNYIKKLRGDVEVIGSVAKGDNVQSIMNVSNKSDLYLFDNLGYVYKKPIGEIRPTSTRSNGVELNEYLDIRGDIINAFTSEDLNKKGHLISITKKGLIKKMKLDYLEISNTSSGIIYMKLNDSDEVHALELSVKNSDRLLVYTNKGMCNLFNKSDFSSTQRLSKGRYGIRISNKDFVKGIDIIRHKKSNVFIITNKGYGKLTPTDSIPKGKCGDEGERLTKLRRGDRLNTVKELPDELNVRVITNNTQHNIPHEDIPVSTRISKGEKLIGVPKGDTIIKAIPYK